MASSERMAGAAEGGVRWILRLEGLALFGLAVASFAWQDGNWWVLALLFLAPDLTFLAYLLNPQIGAIAYNAVHTTIGPIALLAVGLFAPFPPAIALALIWTAHVGLDRALGYGLKYPIGFGVTHLGRIGKT